ncbi:MAG: SDR family NAD(P)-dependent oxidoreductase [Acidimicrobiales bacterium]
MTGASSGIGEAFARRLAASGTDLVLVARRVDRLQALAGELGPEHGVEVEVVGADLTDAVALTTVERRLADADSPVDLLVNNAGFGTAGPFATLPMEGEEREIVLNVVAVVRLTRAALPPMLERGGGAIVNVSSTAGFQPLPQLATYAASKAFVTSFTQAVAEEVRGRGVAVQALCPGLTRTEFHQVAGIGVGRAGGGGRGPLWQGPDRVAARSLSALGGSKVVCIPGRLDAAAVAVASLVPRRVRRRLAGAVARRAPWLG